MDELKKDDVGTTGDGLGEGASDDAAAGSNGHGGGARDDNATARSRGSIASGGGDEDLTQASGGSVD